VYGLKGNLGWKKVWADITTSKLIKLRCSLREKGNPRGASKMTVSRTRGKTAKGGKKGPLYPFGKKDVLVD